MYRVNVSLHQVKLKLKVRTFHPLARVCGQCNCFPYWNRIEENFTKKRIYWQYKIMLPILGPFKARQCLININIYFVRKRRIRKRKRERERRKIGAEIHLIKQGDP